MHNLRGGELCLMVVLDILSALLVSCNFLEELWINKWIRNWKVK